MSLLLIGGSWSVVDRWLYGISYDFLAVPLVAAKSFINTLHPPSDERNLIKMKHKQNSVEGEIFFCDWLIDIRWNVYFKLLPPQKIFLPCCCAGWWSIVYRLLHLSRRTMWRFNIFFPKIMHLTPGPTSLPSLKEKKSSLESLIEYVKVRSVLL